MVAFRDRTGEELYNKRGKLMRIVEYNSCKDIIVEFPSDYNSRVHTTYKSFINGTVKSPYDKTVYGIGFKGVGKYESYYDHKHAWDTWEQMLRRCYSENFLKENQTYKNCKVCEEWHNFQNFAEWYYANYYEVPWGENIQLDKDIIKKYNKIYCPDYCVFVPHNINSLILNKPKSRGKYPIGCYLSHDKIAAHCNTLNKTVHLGRFNTVKEAFFAYKEFKEAYIKKVADNHKDYIPERLYNALYNWTVDITD